MDNFKVGDKVVAPTIFKGIGEVIEVQSLIKVIDLNKNVFYFNLDGTWNSTAELPALHHYKEPSGKLNFLEAMQAIEKGAKVVCFSNKEYIYFFDASRGVLRYSNKDKKDVRSVVFSMPYYLADWYIYEEQETVEWSPKKYDSVLLRDFDDQIWYPFIFSKYIKQHLGFYILGDDDNSYHQGIPLNKDTEHLLGTTDEPKVKYVIKEADNG